MNRWGVASLLLLLAVACGQASQPTGSAERDRVIAEINGQRVTDRQFESFLARDADVAGTSSRPRPVLFRQYLTELLLLQEAEREDITVSDEEIETQVRSWLSQERESDSSLLRERVEALLKTQKLLMRKVNSQITVTLPEMRSYYIAHSDDFVLDDQVRVLEIKVAEAARAREVHRSLEPGNIRGFKEAARLHSEGLTAEEGGDLGTFEKGQLPEDFEKVIFALSPGEVSSIFHSGEGYHIFMLEERVPGHNQRFYEVQDRIFRELATSKERQALDAFVRQLIDNASIKIHDATLGGWRERNEESG